jgi:hypothetical protein
MIISLFMPVTPEAGIECRRHIDSPLAAPDDGREPDEQRDDVA